jgi:enoyl-[acyl-carrier-protein] reductase (NADH)
MSGLKMALSMNRKRIEDELSIMDKEVSELIVKDATKNKDKIKKLESDMKEKRQKLKLVIDKILVPLAKYEEEVSEDEEEEVK